VAVGLEHVRWYADESVLGLGRLLCQQRDDVVHPGHRLVPELPLGALDTEWMPLVADRGWVAFHRDRRIRTRPSELTLFHAHGLRTVWFGGKRDLSSSQQRELLTRYWSNIEALREELGSGPWSVTLTSAGLAVVRLRPA
jgi:hypothetical protein